MQKRQKRTNSGVQLQLMEEGQTAESSSKLDDNEGELKEQYASEKTDARNMVLLVLLYAMQGVPLGLTLGSIPFILKSHVSYTEIGVFSLAAYPYSMKLLWSPIVDTVYWRRLGWRKSWVLPIQLTSGLLMVAFATAAEDWLNSANVRSITWLFFTFVLLAATQDIAVDGWALTLLSRKNVGHASTCQTIGINSGYFLSFTIFLALNDPDFSNSYLRKVPQPKGVLSLESYFRFWGWFYILVTMALFFKGEAPPVKQLYLHRPSSGTSLLTSSTGPRDKGGTRGEGWFGDVQRMYGRLWAVGKLSSIRQLTLVLLLCKLGSVTAEAVGVFKLMEKGVTRETISLIVLIEFPLELFFAVFAGRWASKGRPFTPWLMGYSMRLGMAAVTTSLVALFPTGATLSGNPFAYLAVVTCGVITSFSSTMMFVSQGTFFAKISDSTMGGTYLTLLNTLANLGSAWPKFFIFILIDALTFQRCEGAKNKVAEGPLVCPLRPDNSAVNTCVEAGGHCVKTLDGFYPLSYALVGLGACLLLLLRKKLRELESAKDDVWRV